ncbi:MAG: hypothetical protein M3439_03920 [Chloroflexota bacterium]|nr:hypothetical protein [Chloroflexota bacterium]
MSQSIAPPTTVPIDVQPSADELMTDWLAERVKRAIHIVLDEAQSWNVRVRAIHVWGFEYYEEPVRVIFIIPEFDASEQDEYAYWGVLADAFADINQPRPQGVPNADVTVEVFIR